MIDPNHLNDENIEDPEALFQFRIFERPPGMKAFPEKTYTKWFDYDIINNTVEIRHRQAGDVLAINKNGGTQRLKSILLMRKFRKEEREKVMAGGRWARYYVGGWSQTEPALSDYRIYKKRIFRNFTFAKEKIMAETVRVLVEEEEVDKRIRDLGEQISKDYEGKEVHLICVLKGGVFFMCELAKRITVPVSWTL